MTSNSDQDRDRDARWLRRLALLLLILLGSFCCMLLAAEIAFSRLTIDPLDRDQRSRVEVDYGAGERRAAPLDPQVIEEIKKDLETAQPTRDAQSVTVVPVVEIPPATPGGVTPTAIARVTATPPPTPTPPTTSPPPTVAPDTPTPSPSPTDTPVPTTPPTSTPTPALPTATATSPLLPSDTPTPTFPPPPTAEPTVLPPPTLTPTFPPPPPTDTPIPPPPPTNTPTGMPPRPTTETPTLPPPPTDTPTLTPTATPVPPPTVLRIIPNATVQGSPGDPPLDVNILGENFVGSVAWLGQNITINVLNVASSIITGTLSTDIPVGVYALTVQNSDGQLDTLSPAFTVYPRPHPTTTFESSVAFVTTFGAAAPTSEGDDDHVQIIFVEVPDTFNNLLYLQIMDADTGGTYDETGADGSFGDTVTTYSLRGGSGAYTHPNARADHPAGDGINSGTLVTQLAVGQDPALDGTWMTLPVHSSEGELVGDRRIFKLVVQGTAGDDGNWYQVSVSADPGNNTAIGGARIFAYSWCIVLPNPGDQVSLYPYVPAGASANTQFNFGFDVSTGSEITLMTPLRSLPVTALSGGDNTASQTFAPFAGETAVTWTARYVSGQFPGANNSFSLWFRDNGNALALFTAPTLTSPP